jgi:quercetin dioxygenase-like cupin family protein
MRRSTRKTWLYSAAWLLAAALLVAGPAASTQRSETPVVAQPLSHDAGLVLTAVEVVLAPGAKVARHHHAGTVFAYVLAGSVRSQLNEGAIVEYHAGQSWLEPPGTTHNLTENPSTTTPARFLATFIAPRGAQLTTMETP